MNRKAVCGIMLTILLVGIFAFSIQLPKASGTIYIRENGTVEGTDKIQRLGDIYTFTDNIYDEIVVERDNIIIDGANYTLEGTGSGTGITLSNRVNVIIKSVEIKDFNLGIYFEESSSCRISMTNITLTLEYSIYLFSSSDNTLSGNRILSNVIHGIYLELSNNNVLSENTIKYNGKDGVYLTHSSNNVLSGNTIANNGREGINLGFSSNNVLSGNTITNNGDRGISLSLSSNNVLSGNTITNNDGYGILLYGSSNNNTLSGNTMINNGDFGIDIYSSSNNTLSKNSITNNWSGIRLDESSNNNTLSENNVMYNDYNGIYLDYLSNDNVLFGNTIAGSGYSGVYLGYSLDNVLSENTITGNSHEGILLDDSSNNVLSENNVMYNGYDGITLDASSICVLSENNVMYNGYDGITLDYLSNNNVLSGNTIANNAHGFRFVASSDNTLTMNTIAYNSVGISYFENSSNNFVYHNDFINNGVQVVPNDLNVWDNGYLSGGNYWSDYEGIDQNGDGFGDTLTPHYKDRYPFIIPLGPIPVFWKETRYDCYIDGTVTVSRFSMDESKTISFKMTGHGYVNLTVPRELLYGAFKVFVDYIQIPQLSSWNRTHTPIYLECASSTPVNVEIEAQIRLEGDLNGDDAVDIFDVVTIAKHFGETLEGS